MSPIALAPSLAASDRVGQPPGPGEGLVHTLAYIVESLQVRLEADGRTVSFWGPLQLTWAENWYNSGDPVPKDFAIVPGWNSIPIVVQRANTNSYQGVVPTLTYNSRKLIDIGNTQYGKLMSFQVTLDVTNVNVTLPPTTLFFGRPTASEVESFGLRMQHQRSTRFIPTLLRRLHVR